MLIYHQLGHVEVYKTNPMLICVELMLFSGIRTCNIRGNIPPKQRAAIVESFNSDPKGPQVMLLSLRAGEYFHRSG